MEATKEEWAPREGRKVLPTHLPPRSGQLLEADSGRSIGPPLSEERTMSECANIDLERSASTIWPIEIERGSQSRTAR